MPLTRRAFSFRVAGSLAALGVPVAIARAASSSDEEISHTAESIHMEPTFRAAPQRVYAALTDGKQFDKVVRLSAAMKQGISLDKTPTALSAAVGGAFVLFGGYISGRNVELVPNTRLVQVWKSASWKAGEFSIVRFELVAHGSGTKLVLDHGGFPAGKAAELVSGWKENYFEPLGKYLG